MEYFPYPNDLETAELILRPVRLEDTHRFHYLIDGEPKVWEFDPGVPCNAEERRMWTLRHSLEPDMAAGRSGLFGRTIVRKSDQVILGVAGICPLSVPGGWHPGEPAPDFTLEATLFFQLGYPYWGKGYMTQACRRLMHFALMELGLPRVLCGTQRANSGAVRLMERLGFAPLWTPPVSKFWGKDPVCGVVRKEDWK
jgi:RimJ/RimL family protein N-acetyltransferase